MAQINVQKAANPDDRKLPIFEEIEQMTQKIRDRAFAIFAGRGFNEGQALSDWLAAEHELCWPTSELLEHDQDFALSMAMAGFQPKDIAVTATPRELIVQAKTEAASGDKSKSGGEQVCWSEFRSNEVYRRVELPAEIDVDKVSAQYEHGMLKVLAPKCKQPARVVPIAAAA